MNVQQNDQQNKLSRGQFLTLIGGTALAVGLFKFSAVKHVITATTGANARIARTAYGNSTYGGKKA